MEKNWTVFKVTPPFKVTPTWHTKWRHWNNNILAIIFIVDFSWPSACLRRSSVSLRGPFVDLSDPVPVASDNPSSGLQRGLCMSHCKFEMIFRESPERIRRCTTAWGFSLWIMIHQSEVTCSREDASADISDSGAILCTCRHETTFGICV